MFFFRSLLRCTGLCTLSRGRREGRKKGRAITAGQPVILFYYPHPSRKGGREKKEGGDAAGCPFTLREEGGRGEEGGKGPADIAVTRSEGAVFVDGS